MVRNREPKRVYEFARTDVSLPQLYVAQLHSSILSHFNFFPYSSTALKVFGVFGGEHADLGDYAASAHSSIEGDHGRWRAGCLRTRIGAGLTGLA